MNIYDIFFNICLGLFIGGLIFSIISVFLAQMESQALGQDIDTEVDIDADVDVDVDVDVDIDVDVDVDVDIDADVDIDYDIDGAEFDVDADVDVDLDTGVDVDADADIDIDVDTDIDIDSEVDIDADSIGTTTTPAPIMLLLSAFLLVFGITGMVFYYIGNVRFIMFIGSPIIAFLASRYLNRLWKKIAKSQYYKISSTQNLIGKEGEVILYVDSRGGVIKIESKTPMRFEKVHVKPKNENNSFERGTKVFIVDIKDGFLLVDNKKNKKK